MRLSAIFTLVSSLIGTCACLGGQQSIAFNPQKWALKLADHGSPGLLVMDAEDWPGALRAGGDLAADFGRVTGKELRKLLVNGTWQETFETPKNWRARHHPGIIVAGTIGKSRLINGLIETGKINVDKVEGEWESFQSEIISTPIPGVEALVIAGSDKRGTIYGLYDISEQIGVSPWHWWADVPPFQHSSIYALKTNKIQGPPSVKYRGLFLNDEQPALTNWVHEKFSIGKYDGFNTDFHVKVFELLLRLRANYLWPAEWNGIFDLDDPMNAPLADEYGIVIGTSHTEPLMRWTKEQVIFLGGHWNWETNLDNITVFLTEGVKRSIDYERIYTMGMRGLGDEASPTITAELLAEIVAAQQEILSDVFGTDDLINIPQLWCLYKEVGGYYEDGFRVPDDITLLWADDNWGNIQRLPVGNETERRAGAGVYYHFDYVGGPRDYKWINTVSLQRTWEQMNLAYERQAREIWIVNVGDLKPLEVPISHFFDLAYDHKRWSSPNSTNEWLELWASREFGHSVASEVAAIMNEYGMYAGRRKYELLDTETYSLINYDEAETVLRQWADLRRRAQSIYDQLRPEAQPAFFQLVLHPCKAAHIVHDIYITVAKNNLYAAQRRTSANALANEALRLFSEDHMLTREYHSILDGKWNHMMDQTHLGYSYCLAGSMGVSIEGSRGAVPGDDEFNVALSNDTLVLPPIDPYIPHRWIDIYSRGTESFDFQVFPHNPWVRAEPASGSISPAGNSTDVRVLLTVDWDNAPEGKSIAFIDITSSMDYGNFGQPSVHLPINKNIAPQDFTGFVESDGTVSIEAEHFSRRTQGEAAYYAVIPGYGRTLSGVTLLPPLANSQNTLSGPVLEYDTYIFTDDVLANVTVYLGPSLNTNPERPLKYAVAFDDAEPTIVQYVESTALGTLPGEWDAVVSDAVWKPQTKHALEGGRNKHVLKLWALEPGVVFQKIVVDLGGVRESYLGPPESPRV